MEILFITEWPIYYALGYLEEYLQGETQNQSQILRQYTHEKTDESRTC